MSDAVPPAPAGTQTTPVAGQEKTESPKVAGNQPSAVTTEQLEAFNKRLDGISAALNRFEKETKRAEKDTQAVEPPVGDLTGRVKAVEEQTKKLADKEAKLHNNAIVQTISGKLRDAGVEEINAARFAGLIKGELKGVEVQEGADGVTLKPVIKDGDKTIDLSTYMESYLQTDAGRSLLPPVKNPKMPNGGTPPAGAKPKLSRADMQAGKNFDTATLAKGGYEIVD